MQRFQEKVRVDPDGCHRWTASLTKEGYGKFRVGSTLDGSRRTVQAHRWHWEQVKGPVPDHLEPDHLCRHRECVNLDHLEPVTRSVNQKRGLNGERRERCLADLHDLTDANVYVKPDGRRVCRPCKNEKTNLWKKHKRNSAKVES